MKNIAFVSGGAGYIGQHLIRALLAQGYKAVVYDMHFSDIFCNEFGKTVEMVQGDLLSEQLKDILDKVSPTHVFHLAGVKNRSNVQAEFLLANDVNFKGALNLLNSLIDSKSLKHLIMIGTTEEYGLAQAPFFEDTRELPQSAYGLSKLAATRLALLYNTQFGVPVTIVRPSVAFGPHQGNEMFLPALINTLQEGEEFKMTQGDQYRDFVYIDDLVDALCLIGQKDNAVGEIFNIADGGSILLKDVAKYAAKKLNAESLLKLGAVPYRKFEIMNYSVNIDKAKQMLGWSPKYSVYNAIDKVLD